MCNCFSMAWITTGHTNLTCSDQDAQYMKKGKYQFHPPDFTFQLEGYLQHSILPWSPIKTTRIKRISINKMVLSLIFDLPACTCFNFIHVIEPRLCLGTICVSLHLCKFLHSTWFHHKQTLWKLGATETDPEPFPNATWYTASHPCHWLLEDVHCVTKKR